MESATISVTPSSYPTSATATTASLQDTKHHHAAADDAEEGEEVGGRKVHLVVICHGLWGTIEHVNSIAVALKEEFKRRHAKEARDSGLELKVLLAKGNAGTNTYDGIDFCAERVCEEIDGVVEGVEKGGDGRVKGKVVAFSIVGYSLGGLIARYVLGLLYSRTPSFFDLHKPINFTTFASPAIGMPSYPGFWSGLTRFFGSRVLSRSGRQIYLKDAWYEDLGEGADRDHHRLADGRDHVGNCHLESSAAAAEDRNGTSTPRGVGDAGERKRSKKPTPLPMLYHLASPASSFYKAILLFRRVDIYANGVKDRTVPYLTGAFEVFDPFESAKVEGEKSRKERKKRGEEIDDEVDVDRELEGGLVLVRDSDYPSLLESFKFDPTTISSKASAFPASSGSPKKRRRLPRLPLLLRPSTYPFSRPVSVIIVITLPVTLPVLFILLLGRFALESRRSGKRIKVLTKNGKETHEDRLRKVGFGERLMEVVGDSINAGPSTRSGEGDDLDGYQDVSKSGNGNGLGGIRQGEEQSKLTSSSNPSLTSDSFDPPKPDSKNPPTSSDHNVPSKTSAGNPDPALSPLQVHMIHNLNRIPQLKKHITYYPHVRNSHGPIIARDPSIRDHRVGLEALRNWCDGFEFR